MNDIYVSGSVLLYIYLIVSFFYLFSYRDISSLILRYSYFVPIFFGIILIIGEVTFQTKFEYFYYYSVLKYVFWLSIICILLSISAVLFKHKVTSVIKYSFGIILFVLGTILILPIYDEHTGWGSVHGHYVWENLHLH
jgi:hypothetical protein